MVNDQTPMNAAILKSLKFRFYFGIAAMLLPLLVFAVGAFYALMDSTDSFQEITEEFTAELPGVSQLKSILLIAQMPPNDYLVSGNAAEQNSFNNIVGQIDDQLFQLNTAPFGSREERLRMDQIRQHWAEAKALAQRIFAIAEAKYDPRAEALMKEFDAHINKCVSATNQIEHFAYQEIKEEQQRIANNLRYFLATLAGTLLVGLVLAILGGMVMLRSVIPPLKKLNQGAKQISRGNFKPLEFPHRNEFTQVFDTFNAMAANLAQNQAELKDLAMRDGLTGLLNRREFQRLLEQEIDRARRANSQVSVILLDIDHFKKINDSFGHQVGDQVLRQISTLLTEQIRTMDHLARYGGEEFVIITPEATRTAERIAERIRTAVAASTHLDHHQGPFQITISLGIATCPNHAADHDALIRKADEALYRAKQSGRNRSCISGRATLYGAKVISLNPTTGDS